MFAGENGPPRPVCTGRIGTAFDDISTVTLDAPISVAGILLGDQVGDIGTLNMGANSFSSNTFTIGFRGGVGILQRTTGSFNVAATTLVRAPNTLDLIPNDTTGRLVLIDAQATTAATGNVTGEATISGPMGQGLLTLGTDLETDSIAIYEDGRLDAAGFDIRTGFIQVGFLGTPGELVGVDVLDINTLLSIDTSDLALSGGDDVVRDRIVLLNDASLRYSQDPGNRTGLDHEGQSLEILDTSVIDFQFDAGSGSVAPDWIFRWKNGPSEDRVTALQNFIDAGRISVTGAAGWQIFDGGDGFTYIGFPPPTPYALWALNQALVDGVHADPCDDPNEDGFQNFVHFALNTNPLAPSSQSQNYVEKVSIAIKKVITTDYLTMTLPVRIGAVFDAHPTPGAAQDGVAYRVIGTSDLQTPLHVQRLLFPLTAGMPALDAGWVYHTFRLPSGVDSLDAGFLFFELSKGGSQQ